MEYPERYTRWVDSQGVELIALPVQTAEAILDMRDEYSALLDSMGKNLHRQLYLTPEKRYGDKNDSL